MAASLYHYWSSSATGRATLQTLRRTGTVSIVVSRVGGTVTTDVKENARMATHDIDPVLQQLAQAVNESGQAAVPVVISVRGTILNGALISEQRYFSELVEGNPLLSALEPSSGLLGKEYTKEAEAASGRHLHIRATGIRGDAEFTEGLWRISLEAVDGWTLRAGAEDDRGPFARLLGRPSPHAWHAASD
jgi:hypothetical protein